MSISNDVALFCAAAFFRVNSHLRLMSETRLGHESFIVATVLQQAAKALRDKPLLAALEVILVNNARQRLADVQNEVDGGTGAARTSLINLNAS